MAQVDYLLKIDGIEGESKVEKHKGDIQLTSWSWGTSNSGTFSSGGGGGGGKVSMQDFQFTMQVNKATPKLIQACATGQHIKKAVLTCRKGGTKEPQEYLKITFSDLLVSSYQTGGSGGDNAIPEEQISLNFAKIEYEYREQKSDGTLGGALKAGYDLKLSKVV
jgi:type VI secretion system secreted protein Hcp